MASAGANALSGVRADVIGPTSYAGIDPADWLPHGAEMVLLDSVQRADAQSLTALSARHQRPDHPLCRATETMPQHSAHVLDAVHLLEYAAQAAALHIGLVGAGLLTAHAVRGLGEGEPIGNPTAARSRPRTGELTPGVLAYVRELHLLCEHVSGDDPVLTIEVRRKARIPSGFAYEFIARTVHAVLATGVFGVLLAGASPASATPAGANTDAPTDPPTGKRTT